MRGPEVQNMFYLPRRGVQRQEEELQRLRSGAESEADAEVVGRCEFFLVLQLQFCYLRGQERRRSHLRQGGAQEETRRFEREKMRLHLRRLPDGGELEEVACRLPRADMKSSRAAEWSIAMRCCLGCLRAQRKTPAPALSGCQIPERYVEASRAAEWRSMN